MTCIKKGFATRKSVKLFFKRRVKLSGSCRVYFCEECRAFHHTSQTAEQVRKLKDYRAKERDNKIE